MNVEKSRGLIAAPFTPMKEDGRIDVTLIPAYYRLLKANQVAGAFICGSSGEGTSLTMNEKFTIAEEWARCVKDDPSFRVILMVGGNCVEDCIELAVHAQRLGLYGISVTSPFYYKPANEAALAEFCIRVGQQVKDLAVYYYHIPVLTGVYLSMYKLIHILEGRLENFAGIKYTHEDLQDFLACLTYRDGKYDMLWGRDESLLSGLILGVKSAVGSTYNYAAPLYHRIIEAFEEGDYDKAVQLQMQAVNMISLLGKYGGIGTGKSFMKLIGLNCGKFRLPVKNMSDAEFEDFRNDAEKIRFFNYNSVTPSVIPS